jgi:hypothetical protein
MSLPTTPCPTCGAPVDAARSMDRSGGRTITVWTCGATNPYDGPGRDCPNRDERTTRDETTQPPEAEEPEAMSHTTETAPLATVEEEKFPEVATLPAVKAKTTEALKKLGLALAVVEKLKSYAGLVITDPSDKKASTDADEKRREVKRYRTAWINACKEGRADANAEADAWVKASKTLAEEFEKIEDHLEKEAKRHDDWKAEQARLAEVARRERLATRSTEIAALGMQVADHIAPIEAKEADEWAEYLAVLTEKARREREARDRAARLTEIGDECSPEEAGELTEEQYTYRLQVAQQAQREREETARIKREDDARDAETRRRFDLLTNLGQPVTMERCASALPEEFEEALGAARRRVADALALQQAAAKVPEPVVERPTPSFAIDPIAPAVVDAIQATESQEIEDALAAPTPSAQVVAWFAGIRAAIEASPDKGSDTLAAIAKMLDAVQEVEDAFLPF